MFKKEPALSKQSESKGFTLIELLIVVVVIAILSSMVIVAIGDTRKKARLTAGQSSIASIPPAMVSCLDKGGTVQSPPNTANSRLICDASHQFIADATYPDLTSKGWTYGTLTSSGDDVSFTVTCPKAMCGGTPTGYRATCNTNGCDFANY
ncbi:MAG: type II secretion system protein [Patescibacteria group bacterium]